MSTAKELIENLRADAEQAEKTFSVEIKDGVSITLRYPVDGSEYFRLSRQVRDFSRMLESGRVPIEWKQYVPSDPEARSACFWIAELSVDPKFSQLEALQLCAIASPIVPILYNKILTSVMSRVADLEEAKLDSLGEGLNGTSSGETNSS